MTTNLAVTFGAKWPWLMRGFSLLPSPSGTLAHFLARFLMRFGEMINAAIGEALMDGEREEEAEEEDAAGGRLELFLPMTAFARGAARSALAHARSFARRRSTHFCTRAAHGNVSFPHFRRDWKAATSI